MMIRSEHALSLARNQTGQNPPYTLPKAYKKPKIQAYPDEQSGNGPKGIEWFFFQADLKRVDYNVMALAFGIAVFRNDQP